VKKGINDYKGYQRLASAPIQMAMRIIELENQFKQHQIGSDPNRRQALLERLKMAQELAETDAEAGHSQADDILLEIIDDEEVAEIYGTIKKWYS
jgi:NADH:ubiquinone oxidoreductase subunit E